MITLEFDQGPLKMGTTLTLIRRLLVVVGAAATSLLTSCGPSQEQWKGYGQCMSVTTDKVECARKHDIDEQLVN